MGHLTYVEGRFLHLDSLFRCNHDVPTMRWPTRLRADESGFTLVELVIGIAITGLLISAISSALFVALRTTEVTNKRMAESHDVQIASAYLANDVQSASSVNAPNATTNCSGTFTTLITFTYATSGNPAAVYKCGTAANGETQVTRTFNNGTPIVIAHFAGTARPSVTVTYDTSTPPIPVSVKMTFTKASDCTLDCTYTLYGSRRSFNPSTGAGTGSPPGDIVLLSTGAASPLTVQGKCDDPGTSPSTACTVDPTITALPISPDVQTSGWPTPPPSLWSVWGDRDPMTSVTNTGAGEAKVTLSSVNPPDTNFTPNVELHAVKVSGSSPKITLTAYDGSASPPKCQTKPINAAGNYDCQVSGIAAAAYSNLVLGVKVSSGDTVAVDGVALDTASPQGLLTIKGPLLVNSTASGAVHLFGAKSGSPQLSITNGGGFGTLATDSTLTSGGTCSGCSHSTVSCSACAWNGQNPVAWYYPSIPDPLRSLPAPDEASLPSRTCVDGGTCQPGKYTLQLALTKPTKLNPGIYYLKQGMSISGTAALTCTSPCAGGVMIYVDVGGSVSFTGSSSVNLPALNSKVFAGGLYDGIVMFQARLNSNPVKIAGTSGPNALDGIVYVPKSMQVTLATGNSTFSAKAIVAQQIKVSSPVTIG
jgi:prepilin-type N-terminal cleavage/methylation domain-containing protein